MYFGCKVTTKNRDMQIKYEKKEKNPPLYEQGIWDVRIVFGRNGRCLFHFFEVNVLGGGVATVGGVV